MLACVQAVDLMSMQPLWQHPMAAGNLRPHSSVTNHTVYLSAAPPRRACVLRVLLLPSSQVDEGWVPAQAS
jgi:hypothetical protein